MHVSESLGQDTSAPMFWEARAGEGDEQSSLFGLSDLFGSSGRASDPANQTNETDQTDHPPRPARPALLALNRTNQIDEIDKTDQRDQINQPLSLRKNKQAWEDGMGRLVNSVTCTVEQ